MVRTQTRDDDVIELIGEDGERPRGCQWDETVCTHEPDHRIELGESGESMVLCPRHYATALARLIEVHMATCEGTVSEHLGTFGRV